ncbi:hypothetical protein [Nostoc sp. UHCC 0926]|uniref:hypothetical protein n=1 Tax=Nostoc sp. UHCC 0926 TaxID=3025190 RepID=UPI00235DE41C|nr:hypothetical protein [Nostoc sp. UHCC 0926]
MTNPDYPGHQVALEHQKSDLPLHQETLLKVSQDQPPQNQTASLAVFVILF